MKIIKLTKGYEAIVDDEDFDRLNEWKWQACVMDNKTGGPARVYAHHGWQVNKKRYVISMQREIMQPAGNHHVDHANHNTLDNRRCNLRVGTRSQNSANQLKQARKTSSKYKGVYFERDRNKWVAQTKVRQKRIQIGRFETELEAAKAYDKFVKKKFKEFSKPNFEGEC